MATINNLGKSLGDLTDDELYELHYKIRESRRTKKRSAKVSSKKPKKEIDLKTEVNKMSQSAKDKLIEELMGME